MNWPTPTGIHADRNNHDEPIENYQKRVEDYYSGKAKGKPGKSLGVAARINWPTASARDRKDTPGMSKSRPDRPGEARASDQLPRAVFNSGPVDPDNPNTNGNPRGQLNPDWVETLMGFPIGWTRIGSTDSELSEMPSSQPSPSGPSGV